MDEDTQTQAGFALKRGQNTSKRMVKDLLIEVGKTLDGKPYITMAKIVN